MKKDISINEFHDSLMDEVHMAAETETSGWEEQDFFTAVMLEYLEEAGEIEDAIICPFRGYGLQLNAYCTNEDFENVDIIVSIYNGSDTIETTSRTEIDAAIKRAVQLYRKATNDLYESFEKDSDTYEFAISLHNHKKDIKHVHVLALTDGTVKPIELQKVNLDGVDVSFTIWDLDRLYRCMSSGKARVTIEVDLKNDYHETIPCIENCTSEKYKVYLAIISGDLLYRIYEEHGPRLLERNVRSFLQVKGGVNKGIRDTLRDEPEMFLAYNNGISVTAESVDIVRDENGKPSISKIRDMQIVNGGQTTASIYNAKKDKKINADLDKVYVQMKLSVIEHPEDMDEIVPRISAFANTQNKIQMADFSANDPFHRKIEELSRTIWAPAVGGQKPVNWFYERARGQYTDMLSKESTTLRKKAFKESHPLFTKTDLAKYENTWDQLPYYVSEGAQKNFKRYMVRLGDRGKFLPDASYYQRLIAKAILFRRAEKLIQQQQYGGYRANIVTYTLAWISNKTAQRVDLDRIWKEQELTPALDETIVEVSKAVREVITNPPGGANVGEWCKKEKCWDAVQNLDISLSDQFVSELKDLSYVAPVVSKNEDLHNSSFNVVTEEEKAVIFQVVEIPSKTWYALSKWAKETNNFQGWQRSLIFQVGQIVARKKVPSYKQAVQAMKAYQEASKKGFTTD